jgi:hypothetical protein
MAMSDDVRLQAEALAEALGASPITLTATDTDPPILTLGTAIGLLTEERANPGTFDVCPDWFGDPIGKTGAGLGSGGPALAVLIAQLIGQSSGSSLGIPVQAPGDLGFWYPILNPGATPEPKPTGLYIASTPSGKTGSILGAAVLYQTSVNLSGDTIKAGSLALTGPDGIDVNIWGLVPVLKMDGGVSVALGSQEGPITIGFEVTAGKGENLIATNGFAFSGICLTCDLAFIPSPSVTVSLVIENLKLPTEQVAKDYTLGDLEAIDGAELLALVSALAMGALTRAVGDLPATGYILPAVGLGPTVPGVPDVQLPILRWDEFATLAISGGDIAQPFRNWFTTIAADASLLQAWLAAVGGLIAAAAGQKPSISGTGTRLNPYEIPLFTVSAIGTLSFAVGTAVDAAGLRHLYPGLAFQSSGTIIANAASFQAIASLELMDFLLTPGGDSVSLTGNFSAGLHLAGAKSGDPLFSGTVGGQTYVFGSLTGGLNLANTGSGISLLPNFVLSQVTAPTGKYGSINLLDPQELVTVASAELGSALSAAFNSLFGTESTTVGQSLAALLGVAAPPLKQGLIWPADLAPPFGPASILTGLQNPVSAYTSYWSRLIQSTETVDGQKPLYYIVAALGDLLTLSGVSPSGVTGSGTTTDPWLVALGPAGSVISLVASLDNPAAGATRLTVSLAAGSSLTVVGSILTLLLNAGLLALTAEGETIGSPTVLPVIAVTAALPQSFTTPSVGGAALSVGPSSLLLDWGPANGWAWSMAVGTPALVVDGKMLPVGETMNYSDSNSLEDLVTQSAVTFAPILTGVLGIALYRAQARAGLALDAWFGLLPNLGGFMPPGITWPDNMPVLAPTSFNDPLGQLRAQLQAVLAKPAQAQAALQLLGWAIDSAAGNAAPIAGTGTGADPYRLPLGLPVAITGTLWQPQDLSSVALGLSYARSFTVSGIVLSTNLRLDALALSWATGEQVTVAGVPGLTVEATLANASGQPLVVVSGISVQTVGLAVTLSLGDGFSVTPDLFYTASDGTRHDLTAVPADIAATTTLVNAGLQAALPALETSSQFPQIYELLIQVGLMVPANESSPRYGLDSDGWMALSSDGLSYLTTRFAAILTKADETALLISILEQITGFSPPPLPKPLVAILAGLDLVVPGNGGAVPNPEGIVAFAQDPGGVLVQKLQALMQDADARSLVMAELSQGFESYTVGPFNFTFRNGRTLTLALPPNTAISLGGFARLTGSVSLDLVSGDVVTATDFFVPKANGGLGTTLTAPLGSAPTVTACLTWGDGSVPMPAPLQLWPFSANAFIDSLAKLAPAYALSVFVSRVVEAKLLPTYPLARSLLQLFGLTHQDPVTGLWVMKSTLGLFEDPIAWLLSDAVMGADGTLNLRQIQSVLTSLPNGTAASGLSLKTTDAGATIGGLPYGLEVAITADPSGAGALTVTPQITQSLPLLGGAALNQLAVGLALSAACQPGFSLATNLTAHIPGLANPLSVTAGFNKVFQLSFGESGPGNPQVQLVPFTGWTTLVPALGKAAAQSLLPTMTSTLLQALRQGGAGTLATNLQTAGTALDVTDLVSKLLAAAPDLSAMEAAALTWLQARLSPVEAAATAQAVVGLFSPYISGVTADPSGLVTYKPSTSVPITLLAGVRTVSGQSVIGLWAESAVTVGSFAAIGLAPTGGGLTLAGGALVPSFGFTAQALIAGNEGPGLTAGLSSDFTLSIDPLMADGAASSLAVELLPQPFGVPGSQVGATVEAWLLQVATVALPRYASTLLLNTAAVRQWLDAPLFPSGSSLTAAQVLLGAQLIVDENGSYVLNSLQALQSLGIDGFLAGFVKTLMATQVKIFSLPQNGGIWVEPGKDAGSYGLRVQAPGMMLPGTTKFIFQLGATDTEWINLGGGSANSYADRAGISIYVPIENNAPDFTALQVNLINIGVDFQGAGGAPLMDLTRFKLGAIKPRGLLALDFAEQNPVTGYGGGGDITNIQISLAPNTAISGANVNPVAQNLLGSGSAASEDANPPVNPGFSARAGWINTGSLGVEFYDGRGQPEAELWIPIQRSFGPVHADRIGIGWDNSTDVGSVMFDGSLSLAGLSVQLVDLSVSVNFAQITDYSQYRLDLGGLAVSFASASVTIAGGLFKYTDPIRYDGSLLVKFGTFSLYAVGSFTLIPVNSENPGGDTAVSFFAFLNINAPLGGVPAFFIEGVAGGFGINRGLVVPGAGNILDFPLIQGAISSSYFGGDSTPAKALAKMGVWVPPDLGSYWIAAGFKFSSFKLLTVFTMLMARFGRSFEIDLIGIAQASLPPQVSVSTALAYIELGMVASFKPDEGEISVTAQLTTNSFLLTQSCKLTGGFAALYWFSPSQHAGAFVITLGGYNASFTPPDYYPTVPRLGFNWPVIESDAVSVKVYGGAYFALTPSMVMAGAEMKATFEAGPLSAWFEAGADFLIAWQPFYYMANVRISIGAALTVEAFGVKATLSAELGAMLELWGPETAGKVRVSWYVISFTIPFGNQNQDTPSTKPLSWDRFVALMLPSGGGSQAPAQHLTTTSRAVLAADPPVILTAQITTGLIGTQDSTSVVVGRPLVLTVGTAIPATSISVSGISAPITGKPVGVRPMEVTDVATALTLTLQSWNDQTHSWDIYPVSTTQLLPVGTPASTPGALWSQQAFNPQGLPSAELVDGTLAGLTLTAQNDTSFDPVGPMDLLQAFGFDQAPILPLPFSLTPNFDAAPPLPQTNAFTQLMQSVMASAVVTERNAIWQAVVAHGITAITAPNLAILSQFADQIYVAPPAIAALAVDVAPAPANPATAAPTAPAPMAARGPAAPQTAPTRPPRLLGMAKAYARRSLPAAPAAGPSMAPKARLPQPLMTAAWQEAPSATTPGPISVPVGDGNLAVVDLGSLAPRLSLDSDARVRVVELDGFGRVRSDRIVQGGTGLVVTPETTQLALVGGAADAPVAGWSLDTLMFQANLTTLLAPGCRIRFQASPRLRRRAAELKRGLLTAHDGLQRNHVQAHGQRLADGWLETLFTISPRAVIVAHAGPLPTVRMTEWRGHGPQEQGPVVTPIAQLAGDEGTLSVFAAPSIAAGAELGVWLANGSAVLGVYGLDQAPEALEAAHLTALTLPSFGTALPRAATFATSRVRPSMPALHITAA